MTLRRLIATLIAAATLPAAVVAQYGPTALQCSQGRCAAIGPPIGACGSGIPVYTDISAQPNVQYACVLTSQSTYIWQVVSIGGQTQGTVKSVNGTSPDGSGNVTIAIPGGTVKSVNTIPPDVNGNVTLAIAAGSVTSVNGNLPNQSGAVTIPNVSTTLAGLTPTLSGVATQYLNGLGQWTTPAGGGSGGSSSVGNQYQFNYANGSGGWTADPTFATDNHGAHTFTHIGSLQFLRNVGLDNGNAAVDGAYSFNRAATWNYGTYATPSSGNKFLTTGYKALELNMSCNGSSICQGIGSTMTHDNIGDHAWAYIYDNYMPGTAVAGSDEGYAGQRFGSYPARAWANALPASDPVANDPNASVTNVSGATYLRFNTVANCAGRGSAFMNGSCLTAGQLIADLSDPTYVGLHSIGYTPSTNTSPEIIQTASGDPALTPSTIIASTTSLDIAANLTTGDTVTIPFTSYAGFTDPVSGHACVTGPVESSTEEMGYTISGNNITFTGHRFSHNTGGGSLTIALNSCQATGWQNDQADNCDSGTNACGPTFYNLVGATDAHHALITSHYQGNRRDNVNLNKSITFDGATRSTFNAWPAAMVIDVADPLYTSPFFIYSPPINYAHLATNTAPWAANKNTGEGYWPADTYFFRRDICDTPMANVGEIGSNCNYMEVRGSVQHANNFLFSNNPALGPIRGFPDVTLAQPYSNNNTAGSIGYYNRAGMVPYYGWLVATRTGCGGNLDTPANCPDHYLWAEGPGYTGTNDVVKMIKISDINNLMTFGTMPVQFNGATTHKAGATFLNAGTAGFLSPANAQCPSMTAGSDCAIFTGLGSATNNTGYLSFHYAATGSTSNYVSLGLFGTDHIVNAYGDGHTALAGSVQLGSVSADTCAAASDRGKINYVAGGAGVKDQLRACVKSASDTYAWFAIY